MIQYPDVADLERTVQEQLRKWRPQKSIRIRSERQRVAQYGKIWNIWGEFPLRFWETTRVAYVQLVIRGPGSFTTVTFEVINLEGLASAEMTMAIQGQSG
jgi:hypothetical protein